jgi:hypothetical protein
MDALISSDDHNADGTRKNAKLAEDYAAMGHSIDLINAVIAGNAMANKPDRPPIVAKERQDCVDRNVAHLEDMKAMTDWGSEDMTATTNAINAGKGYTAS